MITKFIHTYIIFIPTSEPPSKKVKVGAIRGTVHQNVPSDFQTGRPTLRLRELLIKHIRNNILLNLCKFPRISKNSINDLDE
jgi:hypothetical protein